MPIEFRYDQRSGILFTTAKGVVSFSDVLNHIKREADAGDLACKELFDATEATTDMSSDEIQTLAESVRQRLGHDGFGPTAIVTIDDVFFGMSRMLEILSDFHHGPEFGVFRKANEALEWLVAVVC